MPKSFTDEAIVLRTYNVGETDRFCLLLTKHHGRIAARANGVRRLLSHRGGGLLPLHRISVVCEVHSFGLSIGSASCLDAHTRSWQNPESFLFAEQGIELLLKLTEEGAPMPQVYELTCQFLAACGLSHARFLPAIFCLKLLQLLGLCPSLECSCIDHLPLPSNHDVVFSRSLGGLVTKSDDPAGIRLSPSLVDFFLTMHELSLDRSSAFSTISDALLAELTQFTHCLTGSQLGLSLKVPGMCFAMSSAVTPI